jgi:hypothetical protein
MLRAPSERLTYIVVKLLQNENLWQQLSNMSERDHLSLQTVVKTTKLFQLLFNARLINYG